MPAEILVETDRQVGIVRIHRPAALNVFRLGTLTEIVTALEQLDADAEMRCMLVAGDERAFGSGADVAELVDLSLVDVVQRDAAEAWERLRQIRKPIVAAVSGFAVGIACELMMACDIVIAAETARFAHPEVNVGVIPGGGATQRLTRAVGKAVAMDVVLTGRTLSAREALQMGLVSRVVPREHFFTEALKVGRELCTRPPLALRLAKEAVLKAQELALGEGLAYERRLHAMLYGSNDQREGMRAYLEQRRPVFLGR